MPPDTVYGFPPEAFDVSRIPDVHHEFLDPKDLKAFETALRAPDPLQSPSLQSPSEETASVKSPRSPFGFNITKRNSQTGAAFDDDASAAAGTAGWELQPPPTPTMHSHGTFITAQNDWAPVNPTHHRSRRGGKGDRRKRAKDAVEGLLGTRTKDETREGYFYQLAKWPLLFFVSTWLAWLSFAYLATRWYIWVYEHFFTWRGRRETLRRNMRRTSSYRDWMAAARELDSFLGRQTWREENDFAYYDSKTVKRVWDQMRKMRARAEAQEKSGAQKNGRGKAVEDLKALIEACVKNNFVGVENSRLYSQTYYGTKHLVQNFVDEGRRFALYAAQTEDGRG